MVVISLKTFFRIANSCLNSLVYNIRDRSFDSKILKIEEVILGALDMQSNIIDILWIELLLYMKIEILFGGKGGS